MGNGHSPRDRRGIRQHHLYHPPLQPAPRVPLCAPPREKEFFTSGARVKNSFLAPWLTCAAARAPLCAHLRLARWHALRLVERRELQVQVVQKGFMRV